MELSRESIAPRPSPASGYLVPPTLLLFPRHLTRVLLFAYLGPSIPESTPQYSVTGSRLLNGQTSHTGKRDIILSSLSLQHPLPQTIFFTELPPLFVSMMAEVTDCRDISITLEVTSMAGLHGM